MPPEESSFGVDKRGRPLPPGTLIMSPGRRSGHPCSAEKRRSGHPYSETRTADIAGGILGAFQRERPRLPTQRAANTSCPRSVRFWLLELRVSRTFLDQLRPQFSGHGERRGLETRAERNKFATTAVGIKGRSRPTLQRARVVLFPTTLATSCSTRSRRQARAKKGLGAAGERVASSEWRGDNVSGSVASEAEGRELAR